MKRKRKWRQQERKRIIKRMSGRERKWNRDEGKIRRKREREWRKDEIEVELYLQSVKGRVDEDEREREKYGFEEKNY